MAGYPDPKPARRLRLPRRELAALHQRVVWGKPCRVCGGPATGMHHVLPRGQGGDDVLENCVGLCGDGVLGCHGRVEARDRQVRALLRHSLLPAEVTYVVGKTSLGWLDANYPEA